jgi:Ku70/Ku80-like protein
MRSGHDAMRRRLRAALRGYGGVMAPRSIWNGTITFGLVNVPIKLYSAIESKTVHFREVHARDGAQIEHRRICPKEDRKVDYDEVVKGYEASPDRYVVLDKEEVKAAAGDRGKVVHLAEFVDADDIDPVFFDRLTTSDRGRRRTPTGCCTRRFVTPVARGSGASPSTTVSTWWRCARSTM